MKLVGLTGGIACGKSTVAGLFAAEGADIVDADKLAREVVANGSDGLAEVIANFGEEFLTANGDLDRDKLGKLVFSDPEARARLGAITHPRIAALTQARFATLRSTNAAVAIYDAPLIVENNLQSMFEALIVVCVDQTTQLQRLRSRDGLSEAEAQARIDSQLPLADKVAIADYVIDNSGDLHATKSQVKRIYDEILG